jgi:hypothetical protein
MHRLTGIVLLFAGLVMPAQSYVNSRPELAAWWKFDESDAKRALDSVSQAADPVLGYSKSVPGVSGRALRFDGLTTVVARPAAKAPALGNSFSVEAWIAIQAYPWGLSAIVSQCRMHPVELVSVEGEFTPEKDPTAGYYFAVDANGRVHFQAFVAGRWRSARSSAKIPLLKWAHIAGTYDAEEGLAVYVNGEKSGGEAARGAIAFAPDVDLVIGRNHIARPPQYPIRINIPASYSFDGFIDEVKIYRGVLRDGDVGASYRASRPSGEPAMSFHKLPREPRSPAKFGAYPLKLPYDEAWEAPRRDGPEPDIVVLFDEFPYRYVFWRGTGFIPHWVTENDIWYTNEFNETWKNGALGCAEPMSDKQLRHSRVRILEKNDARVVVHWRYGLIDTRYVFARVDPLSGWGDWSDEIHTIYPDGTGVRKITINSSQPLEPHEFQESIVLTEPGKRPEDNIEAEALTMVNMKGEAHTYSWAQSAPEKVDQPAGANIEIINTKSRAKPFLIVSDNNPRFRSYKDEIKRENSMFPWWNHWPVAQIPSDGRWATEPDRVSHSSLTTGLEWEEYDVTETSRTRIMLHGLSAQPHSELVKLAKSWLRAPGLNGLSAGYHDGGFDKAERAYVVARENTGAPLSFELNASADQPAVNPAFIVKGWGDRPAILLVDGKPVPRGKDFRYGHRERLDGTDLILWLKLQSTKPVQISIREGQG